MRTVTAIEYITPLREGGSLPAVVEADDGETYVMKFVGAGQGAKALIAELIAGEIARSLDFRIPELVFVNLDPSIGQSEPDPEIQDLLNFSSGLNLGMKFIPHAANYNLLLSPKPTEDFSSRLVWFDAFVTNVDRTAANVNLLVQNQMIWLIDHGASLHFHHNWQDHIQQSETAFPLIKNHVLLKWASRLDDVDRIFRAQLSDSIFEGAVSQIPDQWLEGEKRFNNPDTHRRGYLEFLEHRLTITAHFVEEAKRARAQLF